MTTNAERRHKADLLTRLTTMLGRDHAERTALAAILVKLPARDLAVLQARLRNRLREEAESGEAVGAAWR